MVSNHHTKWMPIITPIITSVITPSGLTFITLSGFQSLHLMDVSHHTKRSRSQSSHQMFTCLLSHKMDVSYQTRCLYVCYHTKWMSIITPSKCQLSNQVKCVSVIKLSGCQSSHLVTVNHHTKWMSLITPSEYQLSH